MFVLSMPLHHQTVTSWGRKLVEQLVFPGRLASDRLSRNVWFFFLTADDLFSFYINLFIILGCVGSSLLRGLSPVAASGSYSSLRCAGFSLRWLLVAEHGL